MFCYYRFISEIISNASFFLFDIATLSIESEFSISSTRNARKRHFELRYRLDFFDSLNLLMISCMKNVINLNQVLKSQSYMKIMKNFNRDKWITIMKNENNFFWSIKYKFRRMFLKTNKFFVTNEFTRLKKIMIIRTFCFYTHTFYFLYSYILFFIFIHSIFYTHTFYLKWFDDLEITIALFDQIYPKVSRIARCKFLFFVFLVFAFDFFIMIMKLSFSLVDAMYFSLEELILTVYYHVEFEDYAVVKQRFKKSL